MTERLDGYYWIRKSGELEVARWDAHSRVWSFIGGAKEYERPDIKVLSEPLVAPINNVFQIYDSLSIAELEQRLYKALQKSRQP